jgi:hypothetical protein
MLKLSRASQKRWTADGILPAVASETVLRMHGGRGAIELPAGGLSCGSEATPVAAGFLAGITAANQNYGQSHDETDHCASLLYVTHVPPPLIG